MAAGAKSHARLRLVLFSLAVALGLVQALATRDIGGGDTLSYLDLADLYSRGDFRAAVSLFWSPLYCWILALALLLVRPAPPAEYPLVAALGFAFYLFWLMCFLYFWRAAGAWRASRRNGDAGVTGLSEIAWLLLGYDLFLWSALELRAAATNNPDQLLNGFVLLAAGLLLRMHRGQREPWRFAALGVSLALGYLAKAAMFPVALLFLAVLWWLPQVSRKERYRTAFAVAGFLLLAGPWIALISASTGRLTFGETGRLNYSFHVNKVPYTHWQGEPSGTGTPQHVSRRVFDQPAVFEFADPGRGTYPVWFDPVRWNQGVTPRFDLQQQIEKLRFNLYLYALLWATRADLLLVWTLLFVLGSRRQSMGNLRQSWHLLLPAVGALAMHALVHFESRHVAAYLALFWTLAFASLRFAPLPHLGRLATAAVLALTLSTAVSLGRQLPQELRKIRERPDRVYWQVAQELERIGARPGHRIAVFGDALWNSSAARLARVQVAAEIRTADLDAYWSAPAEVRRRIADRLAGSGIGYVIAECTGRCPTACRQFQNTSVLPIQGPRTLAVCPLKALP
jgi:hypothetical protein